MKKIINKIANKLFPKSEEKKKILEEDDFYKELFINNSEWNTPYPNKEENARWDIIKNIFIPKIKSNLSNDTESKILDLGCGRGWLSNLLSEFGQVIGIEPVAAVAAYGKEMYKHIDIRNSTADKLLMEGFAGYFDLLVCSEVIEHIPDTQKENFIKNINLLLKDGGYAIISTPRLEALEEWKKYIDPSQPIEDWISEDDLKRAFNKGMFLEIDLKRLAISPKTGKEKIEVYQLWLFQKNH